MLSELTEKIVVPIALVSGSVADALTLVPGIDPDGVPVNKSTEDEATPEAALEAKPETEPAFVFRVN
jgi:hypothetical protein